MTIGGTVSPAGGNFEEPVTQATLKVVGAFHGLSRERSDARRYPGHRSAGQLEQVSELHRRRTTGAEARRDAPQKATKSAR